MIGGREIDAMHFEVAGETAKAFGKNGDVNAPDELMAVVDIEDQDAGRIGSALLLGPIGHAEVEVPFRPGLGGGEGGEGEEDRDEHSQTAHGGIVMSGVAGVKRWGGGRHLELRTFWGLSGPGKGLEGTQLPPKAR